MNESGLTSILNFFSLQKRDDARQFMKFLHPDLGVGKSIRFFFLFFFLAMNWLKLIRYVFVFGILKHFWVSHGSACFLRFKSF